MFPFICQLYLWVKWKKSSFIIGTLYPPGEPILLHLLRYSEFAVKHHSFIRKASHLQQPWLVNNLSQ